MQKENSIHIHIMESDPSLRAIAHEVREIAKETISKVARMLPLKECDIVIAHDPENTIPETGAGGFSPHPHLISIYLDAHSPQFLEKMTETLARTLTHEMHHASRSIVFPWKNPSLLESFITEGLADHFDLEVNGGEPYPWSIALDEEKILSFIEEAKSLDWTKPGGDYHAWNFSKRYPKWAGYSIGFYLVKKYKEKTGKSAAELVHAPAEEFVL